jgi:GNAT superfamily N-acetyltransferase
MMLQPRRALLQDYDLLGILNKQLIEDEGHRNLMSATQLQDRMRDWLVSEYKAVIFDNETEVVAYALYREETDLIYLRQFFVQRHFRQRGYGKLAMELLRKNIWPASKRLTVEVLSGNQRSVAFFRAVGFRDYCVALEILPK